MALKTKNNATSVLAGSIDDAATTFSVASGAGAKFPTLTAGDWFPLTIVNGDGDYEIVRCTDRSGDLFTVTRAQEGTSAAAFDAGSRVDLRLTAAAIADFLLTDLSNLADPEGARAALGLAIATAAELLSNANSDVITNDVAWDAAKWVSLGNITGAVDIDADTGVRFYGTMIGNVTIDVSNIKDGQGIEIVLIQDGTGSRTVSWNAKFLWPNDTAPDVATAAGSKAVVVSGVGTWDSKILAAGWKVTA